MGYSTVFNGSFKLDKPLKDCHRRYLTLFSETRRMARDPVKCNELLENPKYQELAKLLKDCEFTTIGSQGEYFCGTGMCGQEHDISVLDFNDEPEKQPGLWCHWVPNEDGTEIEWDGGEKFYNYVEWIKYVIENFLKPWGYVLSGEVTWEGDDSSDLGKIVIENNDVKIKQGKVVYEYEE